MSNSSKKKGVVAGVAAVFIASTLAMFGISGENIIEADYSVADNGSVAEMTIELPEEISDETDIVELYCNDNSVTKTLMPSGKLKTVPIVFTDMGNLELRFYKLGEVIGVGRFEGEKLYIAIKDNVKESDTDENE